MPTLFLALYLLIGLRIATYRYFIRRPRHWIISIRVAVLWPLFLYVLADTHW
jgi:hypothetical protein